MIDMILMVQEGKRAILERSTIFAGRLEALRKSRGFATQNDLASAANVRQSQISQYEAGAIPKADILVRLAIALHTSVDYLLGLTDQDGTPLTQEERKLLEALYRGDSQTVNSMVAQKLMQAVKDDPALLRDTSDDRQTMFNGEWA